MYKIIVALFYAWYILEFVRNVMKRGLAVMNEFLTWYVLVLGMNK